MPDPDTQQPANHSAQGHPRAPAPPLSSPHPPRNTDQDTSPRTPCPYCGSLQQPTHQCQQCRGLFEPLSRQATLNMMGPWQVRDEAQPFLPGVSHERIRDMVARGKVQRTTVIRGPTTSQFWALACNTQGVAVLLGECHQCHASVPTDGFMCKACGCVLTAPTDRQLLGLGHVRLLPGEVSAHVRAPDRPQAPRPDAPTINLATRPAQHDIIHATMNDDHPSPRAQPWDLAAGIAARHRAGARGRETRAFVPIVVAAAVMTALILWAVASRRTPIDQAVRPVMGEKARPSQTPHASE